MPSPDEPTPKRSRLHFTKIDHCTSTSEPRSNRYGLVVRYTVDGHENVEHFFDTEPSLREVLAAIEKREGVSVELDPALTIEEHAAEWDRDYKHRGEGK